MGRQLLFYGALALLLVLIVYVVLFSKGPLLNFLTKLAWWKREEKQKYYDKKLDAIKKKEKLK